MLLGIEMQLYFTVYLFYQVQFQIVVWFPLLISKTEKVKLDLFIIYRNLKNIITLTVGNIVNSLFILASKNAIFTIDFMIGLNHVIAYTLGFIVIDFNCFFVSTDNNLY